jgi:tetratricopeptide (TPR) repeat protein
MNRHDLRNSKLPSLGLCIAMVALLVGSTVATLSLAHGQQPPSASKKAPALSAQAQRSLELNEQGVTAIKARDFSRAESLFSEAITVDSRNITAVYNLAGMYITNKKEGQAVALLQRYTREFPKDAGLHARLGDAYFGSQDPKNALASYEKALQLDPKNTSVPVRLATLYTMSKKIDKAAKMYEQVIKQNPRDVQSMQNLSSIYLALNKPQQAIATAKKALQISATPELYVTLGNAYQDLKDPRNALISFQRAQELGYKDPNLGKVIEDLAKITSENKRT